VAGAAIGLGTGVSLYVLVMSLFIVHITQAFGWTRGQMAIAGMLAFVAGAIATPVFGRLIDRFGFRPVAMVCVPGLGLVYVLVALNPGRYLLHLALAICGGLFGAGTAGLTYTRPLIAAFDRQRGLALGVATAGTSLTAMAVPPLLAFVIGAYGWRAGLYTMTVLTAVVGLPLSLALIGRAREGTARLVDEIPDAPFVRADSGGTDMTLREAMRDIRFWLLAAALVAVNIPGSGVVGQLAPLVGDKGLPAQSVALVMSIYSAGVLIGRLVTGLSLDRLSAPAVAAAMTVVSAAGIALLLVTSSSLALAAIAVAMIGLQQGSEIDLMAYFVSRGFGRRHYGAIYGTIAMAGALSTAFALVFFGRVHDVTGSYDIALLVGVIAFGAGAAAFAAIGLVRFSPATRARAAVTSPPD
jgi:MFS family permease